MRYSKLDDKETAVEEISNYMRSVHLRDEKASVLVVSSIPW
jgi:hypothetical protein